MNNLYTMGEELLAMIIPAAVSVAWILVLGLVGYVLFHIWINRDRARQAAQTVTLLVRLPKDNETKIEAAEQMFDAIHALKLTTWESLSHHEPNFAIEIVARKEDIAFYLSVPQDLRDLIEKDIHAAYPNADIAPVVAPNIWTLGNQVAFTQLKLFGGDRCPIKTYRELANDGLQTLTSALSKMGDDEGAIVQFLIQPTGERFRNQSLRLVRRQQERSSDASQSFEADGHELQAMEEKVNKSLFKTAIRVCVSAKTRTVANSHLKNIVGSFSQFDTPQTGLRARAWIPWPHFFQKNFIYRYTAFFGDHNLLTFNSEELASLIHFPNRSVETHHIRFLYAKNAPAPREIPTTGLYLGKSVYRGDSREIYMDLPDRRRHMYIIGKTGTGKSEFLKEMILQDIANGSGVCAIDPHGEFVEDILQMIPAERAEDVIYFNPSDLERPLGMNMMEADTEEQRHFVVSSVIGLMYKLYDPHHTGIIGPRFEHSIRNAMLTIMYRKGATFIELVRSLTDDNFVQELLPFVDDPMVKRYWTDQMAKTSDFHKSETLDYIVSKFGRFVTNKTMRNIIGQPVSAFNFRQAMDQKKIILCNLSKGILGEEDAKFLGLILVPKVLTAAMSRQDVPMEQREDFFLYVDEFQNYATEDFATILSEARKYRLNLIVANQFIAQIEDDVRNAVFGNVGTIVSFRVGVNDAQYLEHEFAPVFTETDLTNIEKFHVYVKTIVKNEPVMPFSMSLWKDMSQVQARMNPELATMIKQLSRLKYGKDKAEVEAEIAQRARLI
ncbi:ATP-binding protein [bacterium]|nr:ATP-binding protein [bacterium]